MGRLRLFKLVVLPAALVLLSAVAAVGSETPVRTGVLIDDDEDCLEPVPESVSVTGVTDDGKELSLDVLMLLDGPSLERAQEVVAKAQESYDPLAIKLDVRFERVDFVPEDPAADENSFDASTADHLIDDAKKWTFGKRPADVDVVYVLTDKSISDAAGKVDCIGGVRYGVHAYGVGENYRGENLLGLFYKNGTAKIAAHEIGHLMGAHHHYGNCAQGATALVEEMGPNPCTTMFPYLDFISLHFGSLEAATIRGHTLDFASQGPDVEPTHSVEVSLDSGRTVASGVIGSKSSSCVSGAKVELQRYEDEWAPVEVVKANRKGQYRVAISTEPGQYRAFVPERQFGDEEKAETCAQGASAPITIES